MTDRTPNRGLVIFISVVLIAVSLLLTGCPDPLTPPEVTDSGFFSVDLVLVGNDGAPYTKEVHFSETAQALTVEVDNALATVDVEFLTEVSGATVKINGKLLEYGSKVTTTLSTGTNTITVKVSPGSVDPFTYTLYIKRGLPNGEAYSDDATLSDLSISNVSNSVLHPEFTPETYEYDSTVNVNVNNVTIKAVTNDDNASITINGEAFESGEDSYAISLDPGLNDAIEIIVTAEDDVTVKTYTLEVFKMSVADVVSPTITLVNAEILYTDTYKTELEVHTVWSEPGYSAHDGVEGDLTSAVSVSGSVNTSIIGFSGSYTYTVSDTSGNPASATRQIYLVDTEDPVITLNGANPMRVDKGGTYVEPGASVTDNYDTGLSCMPPSGSVNTAVEDTYQITYTVTDSSGNTATEVRNVVVSADNDNEPPVINLQGDNPYTHEVNTAWTDPGYSAIDVADGNLTGSVTISGSVNTGAIGTTTLYYNVSDSSGNAAVQQSRVVNVEDNTVPTITLLGNSEITVAHGNTYSDPGTIVNDNYATGLTASVSGTLNMNVVGTYFLRFDAEDWDDNHASPVYRTVNVTDQTPPIISIVGSNEITVPLDGTYTPPTVTASDNVDGNLTSSIVISGDTVDTETVGTYHIYYDVTDSAGLDAERLTVTVNVEDQEPPVITLRGAALINVDYGDTFTDPGADVTDNWDVVSNPIYSPVAVDTEDSGDYILTYNYTDAGGNAAVQVTRTVTVLPPPDVTPPEIFLNPPSSVTLEYSDDLSYTDPGAIATDVVITGEPAVNITGDIVVTDNINFSMLGTYAITYTVSDSAEPPHTVSVDRTIIIQDTTAPDITIAGGNTQTVNYGSVFTAPSATAEDEYDGTISTGFTITGTVDVDTTNLHGTYTVYYSISDSEDNESTETLTVNIEDIDAPVITLTGAATVTVECGDDYTDAGATAFDNLDGSMSVNVAGAVIDTSQPDSHTVTYTVTDSEGNPADPVTRTVNVVDTTAPVISVEGDNPYTIDVFSSWSDIDPGVSVIDNDVNTDAEDATQSGLDMSIVGTQTLTYNLSDPSGNAAEPVTRTVIVEDNVAPTISLGGISTMDVDYGSTFTNTDALNSVTASDNYDANLTGSIIVGGDTVNASAIGDYTITYDVSDSSDNDAVQRTRTIRVRDLSAPVISVVGSSPITIECLSTYTDAGASAVDTHDPAVTVVTTGTGFSTAQPGTHTVTYTATDDAGNIATATRTVHVEDTTIPVITLTAPTTLTVEVNELWSTYEPGGTASDTVDTDLSWSDVDVTGPNMSVLGTQTVYYNVTDENGNVADTVARTVEVVDTTAPVIILNSSPYGTDPMILFVNDTFTDPGATVTDNYFNYGESWQIEGTSTVNTSVAGDYTVTYTAVDLNSNINTVVRNVEVRQP